MEKEAIFELTQDFDYKGVLFSEFDLKEAVHMVGIPPSGFVAGIMALIYIDGDGDWILKARIKFPSGNKISNVKSFGKDSSVNEILVWFYSRIPQINQIWTDNPDKTAAGILKIIRDLDMIESERIITVDP